MKIKNVISQPIKKGNTIGLIAPSSPLTPVLLKNCVAYFEKLGIKVKIGKNIQS